MSRQGYMLMLGLVFISTSVFAHRPGFYQIDGQKEAQVVFHKSGLKCGLDIEGAEEKEGYLRLFVFSETATLQPYAYESGFYVEVHFENEEGQMIEHYVKVDYYDAESNRCVHSPKTTKLFAENGKLGNFGISYLYELPVYVRK